MNQELKSRLLSLLWRGGAAALVALLSVVVKEIPDIGMPEFMVVMVTLVINEITKWLNKTYNLGARLLGNK